MFSGETTGRGPPLAPLLSTGGEERNTTPPSGPFTVLVVSNTATCSYISEDEHVRLHGANTSIGTV